MNYDLCLQVPSLPPIVGDSYRIWRIVYQLCENALKFTAKGTVALTATDAGEYIDVKVADTGCGFDMSKKDEIFAPFIRLEPGTYYGLGLGLTMVKDVIAKGGGEMTVQSEKDKGTTLLYKLPKAMKGGRISEFSNLLDFNRGHVFYRSNKLQSVVVYIQQKISLYFEAQDEETLVNHFSKKLPLRAVENNVIF